MTLLGWLQIGVLAALVTAAVKPLGAYIARVVAGAGRFTLLEHGIYRLAGVDPTKEQSWVRYALAVLWFHLAEQSDGEPVRSGSTGIYR